jgi:hypothetical protein
MSGYLQRLALGARNPHEAIHPTVGSLYSAPEYESKPPVWEKDVDLSSQTESFVPPTPDPVHARTLVHDSPRPRKGADVPSVLVGRVIGKEESVESDLPPLRAKEQVPRPVEPTESLGKETAVQRVEALQPGPQPETIDSPETILRRPYRPLVVKHGFRTSAERTFLRDLTPQTPFIARQDTRKEKAELFQRTSAPEREPDDIQIQIGRIEVVAVPPPAPRPAAAPARKSLNLEEYLKRGRGRGL